MKTISTLLIVFCIISFGNHAFSQIEGVIKDENNAPIPGVLVVSSENEKVKSDFDGNFKLKSYKYPLTVKFIALGYDTLVKTYVSATISPESIVLFEPIQNIGDVVVSASRHKQRIEDISVSMEVLKPELIENKGITDVEGAVNQSPGAYAMDGQISIRGGSGFSYGAGSRVLVVWNDVPLLSADAGDAKWESISLENLSQIEIIKGASSVLYGSGALNGIVSLRDKEPGLKPETKANYQVGIFDNPSRATLKWWDKAPITHQLDVFHGRKIKNVGFTISAYGYTTDGYREGEEDNRFRTNASLFWRPKSYPKLKVGVNASTQIEKKGVFIIWQSDTNGYQPAGGADPFVPGSSLSLQEGLRFNIDPYLKVYDKWGNKHDLQTRYYVTNNRNITNPSQGSVGKIYYADYKFERVFNHFTLTSGISNIYNKVESPVLYGFHTANNASLYTQGDLKYKKLNLTGGIRLEHFQQDDLESDSRTYLFEDSLELPFRPVLRAGANYKVAKYTNVRASIGQGFRYPSVAERFTTTNVGALNVFPNPDLNPEKGWSAEIGVKQGVKIGNWKGFVDVSGFINQYADMMEFTFGYFKPDSIPASLDPNNPGYIPNWFGFRAQNAEEARILGAELSISGQGKIGDVEVTTIMGYTYMDPQTLNADSAYRTTFSDTSSTMLKYRFNHLAKADIQAEWKGISLGFSARYNSYMENIDAAFEDGVFGQEILVGFKNYREENQHGDLILDARAGYQITKQVKFNFIVNNLMNREYMTRPGDIRPPRQFVFQLQAKF